MSTMQGPDDTVRGQQSSNLHQRPRTHAVRCPICGKVFETQFKTRYCSIPCKKLGAKARREHPEWYRFQIEVASPLRGRILGGTGSGEYGDVETADHMIELKLSAKEIIRIDPSWVIKIQRIAEAHKKFPILCLAVGGLMGHRVVFLLAEEHYDNVRSWRLLEPLIASWAKESKEYWAACYAFGQTTLLFGVESLVEIPGVAGLLGVKAAPNGEKIQELYGLIYGGI